MTRFSETDKWKDPWFRSLKPEQKLLFLFIVDNCNNAGFWEEDKEWACFSTGMEQGAYEGAMKALARGLQWASGWCWVRRFLKHQKNENLNPENKAHGQIIRLLREQTVRFSKAEGFDEFIAPYKGLIKGLSSPTGICKGKGIGSGKDEEGGENSFTEPPKKATNGRKPSSDMRLVDEEVIQTLKEEYSDFEVSIEEQASKARQWLKDNPEKGRSMNEKFFRGWLRRGNYPAKKPKEKWEVVPNQEYPSLDEVANRHLQ